jgi:ubiquinone/menaquinone biosynthesis C-methylase UbiE
MSNKNTYNNVSYQYQDIYELQRPEKTIFNILESNLVNMKVLDIGVGAGRTSLYLANKVKEYHGLDYSDEMIELCKNNICINNENTKYDVCDVRDMNIFNNDTFDLVLFSFNGLDYISHQDRLKALKEIHRVSKEGAYFIFSTHNLQYIDRIFLLRYQFHYKIKRLKEKISFWFKLKYKYNDVNLYKKLKESKFAIFNDGAHDFGLLTYYINPKAQIQQLNEEHFTNIDLFSVHTGDRIDLGTKDIEAICDASWVYYMCNINKKL